MVEKTGVFQVYTGWDNDGETTIVADEAALFWLWNAVAEAIISEKGRGSTLVGSGKLTVIRVSPDSNFLKKFSRKT